MNKKVCIIQVELKNGLMPEEIDIVIDHIAALPYVEDVQLQSHMFEYYAEDSDDY